jgi:hypothetical protein
MLCLLLVFLLVASFGALLVALLVALSLSLLPLLPLAHDRLLVIAAFQEDWSRTFRACRLRRFSSVDT